MCRLKKFVLTSALFWFLQLHIVRGQFKNITLFEEEDGINYHLDYFQRQFYNFNNNNITRIVGGKPIPIRRAPWQIALYNDGYFICGGSIISVHWVMTAAHCIGGGGSYAVRAGSPFLDRGGQIRRARIIVVHGGYNGNTGNRDIALIRVRQKFRITKYVKPIALARRGRRLPKQFFVSGWGTTSENGQVSMRLRGVKLRKISRRKCQRKYANDGIRITKFMICAKRPRKDSCQGDSGGPLVRRRIQYGIVSFGIGCARPKYPGVYTNVPRLNKWIRKVVKRWGGINDLDYFDPKIYNINGTRIIGGKSINIEQVPWQIALYDDGYFICGGSLISADWVLTAAHCVKGGGKFAVRAGSSNANRGGQIRRARLVVIHEGYNSYTANRDIAMIRVSRRFTFNRLVRPIVLSRQGRRLPKRFFVSGWGARKEGGSAATHLRGVTIHNLNRGECRRKYARDNIPITGYMFCATTPLKDACQGDSGGPLVHGKIQYGIVSFGIGCARPKYPGVYTNIRKMNKWIRKVIRRRGGKTARFG
ncbi:uncharacterized protein [Musca autumnalis]|uniref:uncharacterized protein n=1 Tax=Musca autumnalis TaxID=221902 RepID=UPI003CF58F34